MSHIPTAHLPIFLYHRTPQVSTEQDACNPNSHKRLSSYSPFSRDSVFFIFVN